jgi:F-type H+-transporting ATPase subunit delta
VSDTEVITGEAPLRYAQALLELAEDAKSLNSIEKDMKTLKGLLAKSADLQAMLNSPVFATEDKVAALTAVAKKAKLKALTTQFVGTVAENRRADQLPGIIAAFEDMVARRKGSQVAKVTSAQKLTAAQVTSLKSNLKKSLGRPVQVETTVDPDLLGGFVVRVGSRLYDSSLKTKLEDLRLTLKEA